MCRRRRVCVHNPSHTRPCKFRVSPRIDLQILRVEPQGDRSGPRSRHAWLDDRYSEIVWLRVVLAGKKRKAVQTGSNLYMLDGRRMICCTCVVELPLRPPRRSSLRRASSAYHDLKRFQDYRETKSSESSEIDVSCCERAIL
jgi:hypothetical protein